MNIPMTPQGDGSLEIPVVPEVVASEEFGLGWLADLVPSYLAGRDADLAAIERCFAIDDFVSIQSIGHNLKGSGSSYGFPRITELGDRLEVAAKVGDHASIGACLGELREYLQTVQCRLMTTTESVRGDSGNSPPSL